MADGAMGSGTHRDLLAAIASGLVAALALATSTYNVYLQREQIRAQVWPRLEWSEDLDDGGVVLKVTNRGAGPAVVKRVRVKVDGAPVGDWTEASLRLLRRTDLSLNAEFAPIENRVMSPGQEIETFRSKTETWELLGERRRLDVEICYCSTLNECWTMRAHGTSPAVTAAADECAGDAKPFVSIDETVIDDMVRARVRHGAAADAGGG